MQRLAKDQAAADLVRTNVQKEEAAAKVTKINSEASHEINWLQIVMSNFHLLGKSNRNATSCRRSSA